MSIFQDILVSLESGYIEALVEGFLEKRGKSCISDNDKNFVARRCVRFLRLAEIEGLDEKLTPPAWNAIGSILADRDVAMPNPRSLLTNFNTPLTDDEVVAIQNFINDFLLENRIAKQDLEEIFHLDFFRCRETMELCYTCNAILEKQGDSGEFMKAHISNDDNTFAHQRCALFMEKLLQNGIGQDWNEEMWATAGDILSDHDWKLNGRNFIDNCEAHCFSRNEAERADRFMRQFILEFPPETAGFSSPAGSPSPRG